MRRFRLVFLVCTILSGHSCAYHVPLHTGQRAVLMTIPADHEQAVVVTTNKKYSRFAKVSLYKRKTGGWKSVGAAMSAVVGRSGIAVKGQKKEGDGFTPTGIFELKRAFGYAPSVKTGLDYRQVTEEDFWVDDPASVQYNRWITVAPSANSYEILKRKDDLYRYAIVVEYNTDPIIPGDGSAIFMHVWRNKKTFTAGCVALSKRHVKRILRWLDSSKQPIIILGNDPI